jgi:hypothetical protein
MTVDTTPETKKDFRDLLDRTIAQVKSYEQSFPEFETIVSVRRQLEFMNTCSTGGHVPTKEELQSINVGLLAVREFSGSDPKLADRLMDLDYSFKRWGTLK